MIVSPIVTCPSPATTMCRSRRTERIVVLRMRGRDDGEEEELISLGYAINRDYSDLPQSLSISPPHGLAGDAVAEPPGVGRALADGRLIG
jgi:hypothetical protein